MYTCIYMYLYMYVYIYMYTYLSSLCAAISLVCLVYLFSVAVVPCTCTVLTGACTFHRYMYMYCICAVHLGMTQRVPSVLKPLPGSGTKQSMGRKRSITSCPPVKEPLAEFIRNTCELCCHMYI